MPANVSSAANTAAQTPAAIGDALTFSAVQAQSGTAISHAAGSADFILTESGIYVIEYNTVVSSAESPSFTAALHLEQNGTTIPASRSAVSLSAAADEQTLSGRAVITLTTNPTTITLVTETADTTYSNTVLTVQKLD